MAAAEPLSEEVNGSAKPWHGWLIVEVSCLSCS